MTKHYKYTHPFLSIRNLATIQEIHRMKFPGRRSARESLSRVFDYHGSQIRTVIKDGEPWFVAKDVCDVLEIDVSRLC